MGRVVSDQPGAPATGSPRRWRSGLVGFAPSLALRAGRVRPVAGAPGWSGSPRRWRSGLVA